MSRNLARTDCEQCSGNVVFQEDPRPIREEEAGVHFTEYRGMIVANAICSHCGAKYLAWCSNIPGRSDGDLYRQPFCDLSFRSTFNDEPGEDDKGNVPTPLDYDEGVKKFAADVERELRPYIPKRLRLTCERFRGPTGQQPGVLLGVWDEEGRNVAHLLHFNTDPVDGYTSHVWQNLIARSLMRIEVERDKERA